MMSDNDLPDGFKETEIGPIPAEWEVVPFEWAVLKKRVKVGKVQKRDYKSSGRFPVVDQGKQFIAGYWDDPTQVYTGDLPVIIFGDHTRVFKFVDFPFVAGADGVKVLLPNTNLYDPHFLYFAFTHLRIPSKGYNRHFKLLKERVLPLPPLPEQRRIAHILRTIQRAIEATDAVIAAARELKRSLMQRLFTYGPGPEPAPTKQTEIGEIPAHWEVVQLNDLFEIRQGKALSRKRQQGLARYYFLRTANVRWGKIDLSFVDEMGFTSEEVNKFALKPGDLLVCEGGEIGRTALWREEGGTYCYQNHLHRLRTTRQDICPLFYMYWMQTAFLLRNVYHGIGVQTTISNLSRARLSRFLFLKPPLPEQRFIARLLYTVDHKIDAEEQRKAALQALFKSMLHRLMTGQVRV